MKIYQVICKRPIISFIGEDNFFNPTNPKFKQIQEFLIENSWEMKDNHQFRKNGNTLLFAEFKQSTFFELPVRSYYGCCLDTFDIPKYSPVEDIKMVLKMIRTT